MGSSGPVATKLVRARSSCVSGFGTTGDKFLPAGATRASISPVVPVHETVGSGSTTRDTVAPVPGDVTTVSPDRRTFRRLAAAAIALAVCASTAGCDNDSAGSSGSGISDIDSGRAPDQHGLPATALRSAVEVVAVGCGPQPNRGIGGVLDGGAVVTAAHTVSGATSVDIVAADETVHTATVVLFDETLDIALLRTDAPAGAPAEISTERPEHGVDGAIAVRPPGATELVAQEVTIVRPVTIRTTDIHRDDPVERAGYELHATVAPGDSGTLVHVDGGAIGIVWARSTESPDRAWAVALPDALIEPSQRDGLVAPVDTGTCV